MLKDITTPQATPDLLTTVEMKGSMRELYIRYFFVAMACIFPIIIVFGFTPSYLGLYAGQYQPHWFVHVHGAIMSSWLVVFLTQTILAARGNLKYHRQLGQFAAVLGIVVWLVMIIASTRARLAYPPPVEDFVWDILLIEMSAMMMFGLFFTWGILVRKEAAAHKRLLLIATTVLIQAGIDRIPWLPGLHDALFVRFIYQDALLIPLVIYDLLSLRKIHYITIIASVIIVAAQTTVTMSWGSPAWHQFWFNRLAPFVEQPVEVKLNETQIALLVGEYGDQYWVLTISSEGDKLYLKLPDTEKMELRATSETELFVKTMVWKLSFVKDGNGHITKVVNKQSALIWEANRFK